MLCIDTIGILHPLESELDEESFQHIIYGLNKILLILRDGKGVNKRTIKEGGKVLFRLARIIQAYVHKKNKENMPAEKFAKHLLVTIERANDIFIGSSIPRVSWK